MKVYHCIISESLEVVGFFFYFFKFSYSSVTKNMFHIHFRTLFLNVGSEKSF